MLPAAYAYNAIVKRVVDVDTVLVDQDFGLRRWDHDVPVRLAGCNGREKSAPGGQEAIAVLQAILWPGRAVVLHTVKPDKYAPRVDAAIETSDHLNLAEFLIGQQWLARWDGRGPRPVPPWPRTIG